jgi:hypothetical protein
VHRRVAGPTGNGTAFEEVSWSGNKTGARLVRQHATEAERAFVKRWWERGQLYVLPKQSCLDDFLWMLASASEQRNASRESPPPRVDDDTLVITNDLSEYRGGGGEERRRGRL